MPSLKEFKVTRDSRIHIGQINLHNCFKARVLPDVNWLSIIDGYKGCGKKKHYFHIEITLKIERVYISETLIRPLRYTAALI
jgi:hypothetical protein